MNRLIMILDGIKKQRLAKASDLEVAKSKRIQKDISSGINYSLVIRNGKLIAVRCDN